MRKVIIITICIISILMLTVCNLGYIKYISGSGYEEIIVVPDKYKYVKGYHWEDNKLIIEFAEDENE